jgi:VanZ family protein
MRLPQGLLTAVTVAAVLYLTLVPRPLPDMDMPMWEHTDKVVHALMMLGVLWAANVDIMRRNRIRWCRMRLSSMVWLTVAVMAFGGVIELAQGAMQMGRGADWVDFAADCAGAVVAAVISWLAPWPYPRRQQAPSQTGREPR